MVITIKPLPAPREVAVRKWSAEEETLVSLDEDDTRRFVDGVRGHDFDQNLGTRRAVVSGCHASATDAGCLGCFRAFQLCLGRL